MLPALKRGQGLETGATGVMLVLLVCTAGAAKALICDSITTATPASHSDIRRLTVVSPSIAPERQGIASGSYLSKSVDPEEHTLMIRISNFFLIYFGLRKRRRFLCKDAD